MTCFAVVMAGVASIIDLNFASGEWFKSLKIMRRTI